MYFLIGGQEPIEDFIQQESQYDDSLEALGSIEDLPYRTLCLF